MLKPTNKFGSGTICLQGTIDADYQDLVRVFGRPNGETDGYKVDVEWWLETDDGDLLTIYNYKDGKNYCGANGLDVDYIRDWHIGGSSRGVVDMVKMNLNIVKTERKGACVGAVELELIDGAIRKQENLIAVAESQLDGLKRLRKELGQ